MMRLRGGSFLKLDNVTKIVCDGNSITLEGRDAPINGTAQPTDGYPDLLGRRSEITSRNISVINIAVGGQSTTGMINRGPAFADVHLTGGGEKILIAWEMSNAIFSGKTAQAAYNDFATYCNNRKTAGWKNIISVSCLARNRNTGSAMGTLDFTKNPIIDAANALLYQNWRSFSSQLLDVRRISELNPLPNQQLQIEFIPDQVHPNTLAHSLVLNNLMPILARMPKR